MKNNNKGFTLVELLAVIVILAVIILIAVNAIIPQMNKARKNSVYDEALTVAKAAETYYVAENVDGSGVAAKINKSGNDSNNAMCVTIDTLKNGYIKKNSTDFKGVVVLTESANGDDAVATVYLTNGKYYVNGKTQANITKGDVQSGGESNLTLKASDCVTPTTTP